MRKQSFARLIATFRKFTDNQSESVNANHYSMYSDQR